MEAGREHCVPLSYRAVEIIAEARQHARKEPELDSFVFFGMRRKKPVSPMAMMELLRRMKVNATVHGFRAAFRMWAADVAHAPFEIAEAVWRTNSATQWCRPIRGRRCWRGVDQL